MRTPLEDFSLDLGFKDLMLFKKELVDYSTMKGFEFKYIMNDIVKVRAICSRENYKWLILCSWCCQKKAFVVKNYVP